MDSQTARSKQNDSRSCVRWLVFALLSPIVAYLACAIYSHVRTTMAPLSPSREITLLEAAALGLGREYCAANGYAEQFEGLDDDSRSLLGVGARILVRDYTESDVPVFEVWGPCAYRLVALQDGQYLILSQVPGPTVAAGTMVTGGSWAARVELGARRPSVRGGHGPTEKELVQPDYHVPLGVVFHVLQEQSNATLCYEDTASKQIATRHMSPLFAHRIKWPWGGKGDGPTLEALAAETGAFDVYREDGIVNIRSAQTTGEISPQLDIRLRTARFSGRFPDLWEHKDQFWKLRTALTAAEAWDYDLMGPRVDISMANVTLREFLNELSRRTGCYWVSVAVQRPKGPLLYLYIHRTVPLGSIQRLLREGRGEEPARDETPSELELVANGSGFRTSDGSRRVSEE